MSETDKEARIRLAGEALILQGKIDTLKPILKQIEVATNLRPPVTSIERLLLNELWFCVWDVLESSEFKEKDEDG